MKIRPYVSVFGCFLIHFGLGSFVTFGNINPYLTSYLKNRVDETVTKEQVSWVLYTFHVGISFIHFGGWLGLQVGRRKAMIFGSCCFIGAIVATHWSIKTSLAATIIVYGAFHSFGLVCVYGLPVVTAIEWFPEKKSLATGVVASGFAACPVLMNNVQTFFVNPNNLNPTSDGYFDDPDILDAIPSVFLLTAGVHGCFLFVGLLLYSEPKSRGNENSNEPDAVDLKTIKPNCQESLTSSNLDQKGLENTVDTKEVTNENSPRPELVESKEFAVTPQEALKSKQFYLLVITAVCSFHSLTFVNTFYKIFGQSLIQDDKFLATVGSVSCVFHAVSRVLIGLIQQKSSYKSTVLILFGMKTVLLFTLVATSIGGKVMFLIWVCGLYVTFPICFVCVPAVISEVFGTKYTGMSSIVWPVIFTELIPILGWFGMFCIMAVFSSIGILVTMLFPETNHQQLKTSITQKKTEKPERNYGSISPGEN
ncbi:apicoplast pyruvate carrier 1-like isoform X2 [Tachypleus tridentatus]|uniref:apicoplast pyruvate carrier 1-like isoform X2 n=1 Tax=Tachypleus tridentatus TaxID=6853 RepID=UPI003FD1D17E